MKIKTVNGWEDFIGIKKVKSSKLLKFTFESGKTFECTPDHKIYIEPDLPIWAEMLSVGECVELYGKKEKITGITETSRFLWYIWYSTFRKAQ